MIQRTSYNDRKEEIIRLKNRIQQLQCQVEALEEEVAKLELKIHALGKAPNA